MSYLITATEQLGPTLRGLRRAAGKTQTEVARLGGLQQKTVSMLENEPRRCSVDSLVRYLVAVGAPLELSNPGSSTPQQSSRTSW